MVTKRGEIARGEIYQGFQLINNQNRHNLAKSRHFRTPQKSSKLPLFVVEQNLRIFHHLHLEIAILVKKISNSGSPETLKTFENNDSKGN